MGTKVDLSSTKSQLLLAVTVIIMQRPNAQRCISNDREEGGGRRVPRNGNIKGASRGKMVVEMACKEEARAGKRIEPVVRRHLAAPYIFLLLPRFFLPRTGDGSSFPFLRCPPPFVCRAFRDFHGLFRIVVTSLPRLREHETI